MVIAILVVSQRTAIGTAAIAATVLKRVRAHVQHQDGATVIAMSSALLKNVTGTERRRLRDGATEIAASVLRRVFRAIAEVTLLLGATVLATLSASLQNATGTAMIAVSAHTIVLRVLAMIHIGVTVLATVAVSPRSAIGIKQIAALVLKAVP
jgi:hypothetical protein